MTGILERKGETYRRRFTRGRGTENTLGECHVTPQAGLEWCFYQPRSINSCWPPPEIKRKPWSDFSLKPFVGTLPCWTLDFRLLTSSTERQRISVLSRHPVFGAFLQLPEGCLSGSDPETSACSAGEPDPIPGSGRSPREGNGNPVQHSCPENSMDRGAWRSTVSGITESWTWLSDTHIREGTHQTFS